MAFSKRKVGIDEGDYFPLEYASKEALSPVVLSARVRVIQFLFIGILTVFLARIFYLALYQGDALRRNAEGNRERVIPVHSQRGIIYDKNNQPLLENEAVFTLFLSYNDFPKDATERQNVLARARIILDDTLMQKIEKALAKKSYLPEPISDIPYEIFLRFTALEDEMRWLNAQLNFKRRYIYGESFAHILGYIGRVTEQDYASRATSVAPYLLSDLIGKSGIEYRYDELLRGTRGESVIENDKIGRQLDMISYRAPRAGDAITLTVDGKLQEMVYQTLKNYKRRYGVPAASVIVMDIRDGSLVSIASVPSYDNNFLNDTTKNIADFFSDTSYPFYFRAISGEYPSGSVIKPAFALTALQEKIITATTTVLSTGGIQYGKWFFPDWKVGGHGRVDVFRALAESINTFFYYIGGGYGRFQGLGIDRMKRYLDFFGFGKLTAIDLPNESEGLVPDEDWKKRTKDEQWYIGDTYHLAIGQGDFLVTPLQIARFTAFLANGGIFVTPHLVVSEKNQYKTSSIEGIELKNIEIVRKGMRRAITDGSARSLNALPIAIAGKTGTAQTKRGVRPHSWFTGFFPYEAPRYAITVMVENGGEGSDAAVPLTKQIIEFMKEKKML
ncbi:MAG: penicillin-binding protein 2 [Parcubacteria group bacterium]|nr:penicillin-binding protein 2 [Parcubacteria group bacterium]